MDRDVQRETRIQEIKVLMSLSYIKDVRNKFPDQPEVYQSFLDILREHSQNRINIPDVLMRVSELFNGHPELIRGFCSYLPCAVFIKDDVVDESMEKLRPAKKAKMEDGSAKPISKFGLTSDATTSYYSNYSDVIHSSHASSSSSYSSPESAAEHHRAQKVKARLTDGTGYVTDLKRNPMDEREAYLCFIRLVKATNLNRDKIHDIMEQARDMLQGYPELIEGFNKYLPAGFRIEVLPNDHEMSTD